MKKQYFIIIFIFITNFGFGQDNEGFIKYAGIYTAVQWSKGEDVLIIPQLYYYENDYYIEARFNYEEKNAFSLYLGRSFSGSGKTDYEIVPVVGLVIGESVSLSPGLISDIRFNRFSLSSETQFTIDLNGLNDYYFWDWTKFNFQVNKYFGAGGGMQFLYPNNEYPTIDFGPMLMFKFKSFSLETYSYSFWKENPTWVVAVEYSFSKD